MKTLTRSIQATMITGLVLAVGTFHSPPASAQENSGPLQVTAVNLTAQEVGRRPAEGATTPVSRPGDVIEYRLVFTNTSDGPVRDVVFDDPIPEGLVYVLGSAGAEREGVEVRFSIDDGSSYSPNPEIEVEEAGATVRRPAPADRYTHVRWTVPGTVAPGEEVRASFRARIVGGTALTQ